MPPNAWISFLSGYRKKNPGKSMKQAMRDGAKVYKSQKGAAKKDDVKPKRKKKAAKKKRS